LNFCFRQRASAKSRHHFSGRAAKLVAAICGLNAAHYAVSARILNDAADYCVKKSSLDNYLDLT
jgi:hypothetical protein